MAPVSGIRAKSRAGGNILDARRDRFVVVANLLIGHEPDTAATLG